MRAWGPDQVFYLDADYMLRRLDYHPQRDQRADRARRQRPEGVRRFIFPTRRHVYRRNEDGTADKSLAAITIPIDSVSVQRR